VTGQQVRQAHGAVVSALLLAILIGMDIALGIPINGSYALSALLAAAMATSIRFTAGLATLAVALSAASGLWNANFSTPAWGLRLVLCATLAVLAVVTTSIRARRDVALQHMTLVADTAQRALFRAVPSQVGPVGIATRYVSATRDALVGGDLYEVAASRYGVRVLMGDVRGKGLEAVQMAGTVLGAFRHAAFDAPSLESLACNLDTVVAAVAEDEDFVTCLLAEFHTDGTVSMVNCGHHQPFLVTVGGDSEMVSTGEPVPPLGLAPTPRSVTGPWPDGSRMLFYTDGLVEARNRQGAFFPLAGSAAALSHGDLDEALDGLLQDLARHTGPRVRDDLALLLVEHRAA
jgi:serine phosphatase RsbU (regulator of sigma subunit)